MAEPMYLEIAKDLLSKIESGELSRGSQLPTELELREQYDNASRNTIRDALRWLMTRGLVETRPGRGTFIVEKIDAFVTTLSEPESGFGGGEGAWYASEAVARRRKPTTTTPRVEVQQASSTTAGRLQINEGTMVVSRHQQRYIDQTPWSLQTTFYPFGFVTKGATRLIEATDINEGAVAYLANQPNLGIKQVGYRDEIAVRSPDANETAFFKLPRDGRVPVVEIYRTGFDQRKTPMRLTVTVFPADRNKFVINAGDVPNMPVESPTGEESGVDTSRRKSSGS